MKHIIKEEFEPSHKVTYPRLKQLNEVIYLMVDQFNGIRIAWKPESILIGKDFKTFSAREIQLAEDFYGSVTLQNDD